jgi:FkbM family methyltransferase
LRLVPSGAHVPIIQGPLRGYRWIVGAGVHGYWLGSYEWHKRERFQAAVVPGSVVYDVGAHVGFYTLLAAKLVGPTGRVFAFEPVPRNVKYLRAHLSLNGIPNAEIWPVAVAERSGVVCFDTGPNSQMGRISQTGSASLPCVRLDDLVEQSQVPPPDLIKMDVEGGELDALRGAHRLLASVHPTLFVATHGRDLHRACCDLLVDLGYQVQPLNDRAQLETTDEIVARAASPSRSSAIRRDRKSPGSR